MKKIMLIIFFILCILTAMFFTKYKITIFHGKIQIEYTDLFKKKPSEEKESKSNLILIVTNQSYHNSNVRVKVKIDEKRVINKILKVEQQHNWYYFYFNLPLGEHKIEVTSEDGAEINNFFKIDDGNKKWMLIEYWKDKDSLPEFSYRIDTKPFMID